MGMAGITSAVLSTRPVEVANEAAEIVMISSKQISVAWVTQRHILEQKGPVIQELGSWGRVRAADFDLILLLQESKICHLKMCICGMRIILGWLFRETEDSKSFSFYLPFNCLREFI